MPAEGEQDAAGDAVGPAHDGAGAEPRPGPAGSEGDEAEPRGAQGRVDEGQQDSHGEGRHARHHELRDGGEVEDADLRVEQVRERSRPPAAPGGVRGDRLGRERLDLRGGAGGRPRAPVDSAVGVVGPLRARAPVPSGPRAPQHRDAHAHEVERSAEREEAVGGARGGEHRGGADARGGAPHDDARGDAEDRGERVAARAGEGAAQDERGVDAGNEGEDADDEPEADERVQERHARALPSPSSCCAAWAASATASATSSGSIG